MGCLLICIGILLLVPTPQVLILLGVILILFEIVASLDKT